MPWMLQPHNYSQLIRPNLYRVDYRRVGAYKGMGGLGQDTSLDALNALPVLSSYDVAQAQAMYTPTLVKPTTGTLGQWVQQNSGVLAVGAVLFVMLLASRR